MQNYTIKNKNIGEYIISRYNLFSLGQNRNIYNHNVTYNIEIILQNSYHKNIHILLNT